MTTSTSVSFTWANRPLSALRGLALGLILGAGLASPSWAFDLDDDEDDVVTLDQAAAPGAGAPAAPGMGPRHGMGPGMGPGMGHGHPGAPMGPRPGMHHRGGPEGHGGGMHRLLSPRVLDRVQATPQQRQQLHEIMRTAQRDVRGMREQGRSVRQQLMQQFSQPQVNAAAVEGLRRKMMEQHDQISQRRMKAMLDAAQVFTPEQRAQLGKWREMMERHRRERQAMEPKAKS